MVFVRGSLPFTIPFVQIALMEMVVRVVTTVARAIIRIVYITPASPTIQLIRRNKITPQIFKRQRTKTPWIQPN